ncbi:gas vesicle protein GvpM [Natrialba asiatica]|uniref:Gas vesicle protein GvpA n=1 Tax=Natrialba asiatica (strain ATCC 700177 / DSM 12278 / JCM 9576 / FERM P-10747 / NBRC 102637 / 172P1) TaxID=29540 RepID=M0AY95_NATA1|nr:gas vesicle protein [Natrialba asiatica]ELZ02389.1 gas vesicle protein GvpA [Natrialba asiatica DSM 12278]
MKPQKDDEALVDLLDVILRDGVILRADVIISVAEIPLVGLKLTAALAGMETMTEYGLFEEWDARHRLRATEDNTGIDGADGAIPSVPGPRPSATIDGRIEGASNRETPDGDGSG